MIDKDQLKELGWTDELINEITRLSNHIEKAVVKNEPYTEINYSLNSESSNTVNFSSANIATNSQLKLK